MYKKIALANLDPHLSVCHLCGVVMDNSGSVVGLLLTYLDHGGHTLSTNVDPDHPSASELFRSCVWNQEDSYRQC